MFVIIKLMIKNSQNQIGSAHIVIIVILVLAIIAALGYVVWNNYLVPKDNQPTAQVTGSESISELQEGDTIDTTIHEVNITLESEMDVDKLPSYTPSSFKTHMKAILKNNNPVESNIDECTVIATYEVTKISQVNVQGAMVPTDVNKRYGCAGGAPILWVLTPSASWDDETLNGPSCVSKNGGLVYEEFAAICYTDTNRFGINNPNGSITSIAN